MAQIAQVYCAYTLSRSVSATFLNIKAWQSLFFINNNIITMLTKEDFVLPLPPLIS